MSLLKTLFVILVILVAAPFANDLLALPPGLPDAPDQAPIDGGLGLLAAGGAAYAWKKLRKKD
jgi:hypothetical protein